MPKDFSIDQLQAGFPEITFLREVEEGNIKQVFEAEHDGRHIAFKVVPYERGSRLEGYTEREIDIMKNTGSDVLVDLIDAFDTEIDGVPSYVIIEEWIEGNSLKYLIGNGQHSIELAIQVTDAILDVLPEFDSGNIVHRDIKPENIRKSDGGYIRLLDVGVARMNERETLTPKFERRGPGTPAYSAPEVLRNERYNQDVRSDLFSTGIVFYEAATGEHPFKIPGIETIPDAILEDTRSHFSGFLERTEFEQDLDAFYKRMTEHEPANRYRKAEHAKDDLEGIVEEWMR